MADAAAAATARIQRNRELLAELGVEQAAAAVKAAMGGGKRARSKPKDAPPPEALEPSRRSKRLASAPEPAAAAAAAAEPPSDKPDPASLLTQAEYFKLIGEELAGFQSDGAFKGWVSPAMCELYGIAASAADAWAAGGGGAFTRKPDMAAVPAALKAQGWSDAKAFAATQLRKNPNAYFYRHVAPHCTQAQGEWTEEEHELFLDTARKHGVGDKWGLFASHIGTRVGYQCSAFYRDVMIAKGLIIDARYKMTPSGHVVWVGGGGAGGGGGGGG
ncbi:hypothetical protein HT031_003593 [Scenedesmus sp. PABB004]|nr:hypothetical protein HT031_003593 [Scenedesmus sp. PABB004]